MAKQRQQPLSSARGEFIWMTDTSAARRRSWPGPVTRLERLAERAGIDGDEFRLLLSEAIQERLRERGHAWEKLDRVIDARASAARSPD